MKKVLELSGFCVPACLNCSVSLLGAKAEGVSRSVLPDKTESASFFSGTVAGGDGAREAALSL